MPSGPYGDDTRPGMLLFQIVGAKSPIFRKSNGPQIIKNRRPFSPDAFIEQVFDLFKIKSDLISSAEVVNGFLSVFYGEK